MISIEAERERAMRYEFNKPLKMYSVYVLAMYGRCRFLQH